MTTTVLREKDTQKNTSRMTFESVISILSLISYLRRSNRSESGTCRRCGTQLVSYIHQPSTSSKFRSHPIMLLLYDSRPSILSDLPVGHVLHIFSSLNKVQKEAAEIFKLLNENENCDGNQWIVVLGLSQRAIEILDGERRDILGGTSFRFQLEGSTGLVKIVPSSTHPMIINECLTLIDEKLDSMGIPWAGWGWTERATYMLEGNDTKGKQPDQAFIPPSRRVARMGLSERWPTLVIETGVSKSLPRLRLNARDWFASSNGEVRIVLLVGITNSEILFEKWQLAPISEPRPLTQESIDTLRQQDPKMPPLIGQPASGQQAYCAQEVYLKLNEVVGNPLVLPFHAVCDRAPREGESNIVIERSDFEQITKWIFE